MLRSKRTEVNEYIHIRRAIVHGFAGYRGSLPFFSNSINLER